MAARYCIDASAIIHAWRDLYRPASFPTFWQRIDELIGSARLVSPQEVREELTGPPDLVNWADGRDGLFRELDEDFQQSVRVVLADLDALMRERRLHFLGRDLKADPFVVALARLTKSAVVTQERPRGAQGRPKIPDLCRRHNLRCVGIAGLIEESIGRSDYTESSSPSSSASSPSTSTALEAVMLDSEEGA